MNQYADMIETVFAGRTAEESVVVTTITHAGVVNNRQATPRGLALGAAGAEYYCVSTTRKTAKRTKDVVLNAYVIVCDDIGTKSKEPPVAPSYKMETSPGNFQWGYLLKRYDVSTQAGREYYDACTVALAEAGYNDPGCVSSTRIVRTVDSFNHKNGFTSQITWLDRETRWDLVELMASMGINVLPPTGGGGKSKRKTAPKSVVAPEGRTLDATGEFLVAAGMTTGVVTDKFVEILCPWRHEHTSPGDTAGYTPVGWEDPQFDGAFKCFHAHCQGRHKAEFVAWVASQQGAPETAVDLGGREGHAAGVYLIEKLLEGKVFNQAGQWYAWDTTRWQPITEEEVSHAAYNLVLQSALCKDLTKRLSNFEACFKRASKNSLHYAGALDSDPWLLGVTNGVVDLRTGQLIEARPEQYITQQCSVAWNPEAKCPRFLRLLSDALEDEARVDWMSDWAGRAMTGVVEEDCSLLFAVGIGSNGKSMIFNTLARVLGDYAGHTSPLIFTKSHNGDGDKLKLGMKGKRLVLVGEMSTGAEWDSGAIKQMCSTDKVSAWKLYHGEVNFTPTAKFVACSNDEPRVRDTSKGLWRRLAKMDFNVSFPRDKRYADALAQTLIDESEGILQWMADGCAVWQQRGLEVPEVMAADLAIYEMSNDPIAQWLEANCACGPTWELKSTDLYLNYKAWCTLESMQPWSVTAFGRALATKGIGTRKSHGQIVRVGVTLKQHAVIH